MMGLREATQGILNVMRSDLKNRNEKIDRKRKLKEITAENGLDWLPEYDNWSEDRIISDVTKKRERKQILENAAANGVDVSKAPTKDNNDLRKWTYEQKKGLAKNEWNERAGDTLETEVLKRGLDVEKYDINKHSDFAGKYDYYLSKYPGAIELKHARDSVSELGYEPPAEIKNDVMKLRQYKKAIIQTEKGIDNEYFDDIRTQKIRKMQANEWTKLSQYLSDKVGVENIIKLQNKYTDSSGINYQNLFNDIFLNAEKAAGGQIASIKSWADEQGFSLSNEQIMGMYQTILANDNAIDSGVELMLKDIENAEAERSQKEQRKLQTVITTAGMEDKLGGLADDVDFSDADSVNKFKTDMEKRNDLDKSTINRILDKALSDRKEMRRKEMDRANVSPEMFEKFIEETESDVRALQNSESYYKDMQDPVWMNDTDYNEIISNYKNWYKDYLTEQKNQLALQKAQVAADKKAADKKQGVKDKLISKLKELKMSIKGKTSREIYNIKNDIRGLRAELGYDDNIEFKNIYDVDNYLNELQNNSNNTENNSSNNATIDSATKQSNISALKGKWGRRE